MSPGSPVPLGGGLRRPRSPGAGPTAAPSRSDVSRESPDGTPMRSSPLRVLLMILLRAVERSDWRYLSDDAIAHLRLLLRHDLLGGLGLSGREREDRAPVLIAYVRPLAVRGRRIVNLEERADELVVRDDLRIELDEHRFRVTGIVL